MMRSFMQMIFVHMVLFMMIIWFLFCILVQLLTTHHRELALGLSYHCFALCLAFSSYQSKRGRYLYCLMTRSPRCNDFKFRRRCSTFGRHDQRNFWFVCNPSSLTTSVFKPCTTITYFVHVLTLGLADTYC